jgi:hypothetical protein
MVAFLEEHNFQHPIGGWRRKLKMAVEAKRVP